MKNEVTQSFEEFMKFFFEETKNNIGNLFQIKIDISIGGPTDKIKDIQKYMNDDVSKMLKETMSKYEAKIVKQ